VYNWIRAALAALAVFAVSTTVWAGPGLDRLNDFYQHVHAFRAQFSQTLTDADGNEVQKSSGSVEIQRPDRFRWDYTKPYPQVILGDGQRLWIYDSELEQVTVKDMAGAVGNAPALVLSGKRPLKADFVIKELGSRDGLEWVQLTPKRKDSDFKSVRIGFGKELERLDLEDSFDQTTHIHFIHLQRNPKLDPKLFRFKVPAGVDVVGDY